MPVIEGIQICIPGERRKARQIIARMQALLDARHHLQLGRAAFLRQWGGLRKALFLTHDYQELRFEVLARNSGKCELCGERASVHMHHVVPVSRNPKMALKRDNVKASCVPCHKEQH